MKIREIKLSMTPKMKGSSAFSKPLILLICALFGLSVITATVIACGFTTETERSVRFNSYQTEKDFGRLPPLARFEKAKTERLFSWDEEYSTDVDGPYYRHEKETKEIEELWSQAEQEESKGNLRLLREKLREYLKRTSPENLSRRYGSDKYQSERNIAFDKLDALGALDSGSPLSTISQYLIVRNDYDSELIDSNNKETVVVFGSTNQAFEIKKEPSKEDVKEKKSFEERNAEALKMLYADKNLGDNIAYLEAARLYREDSKKGRDAFTKVAAIYPKSEKREAALFMSAVAAMKQSESFTHFRKNERIFQACEVCRDAYWLKAQAGFERVMHEYPRGRYYSDAQGWLAHLWLCIGERAAALTGYYRMLAGDNEPARVEALYSLWLVRNRATDEEMQEVERVIADEPSVALAYAYHNVYNFAMREYYDEDTDSAKNLKLRRQQERERIVVFANRMIKQYPRKAAEGAFLVRLAEANLELEKFADAKQLARRALQSGVNGEFRAEALWVAGYAEFRLKEYKTAKEALKKLVEENPNNRYTEGARRNLAMLLEDTGELEGALEQYLALDYRHDVAYFIDVLMKPEELAQFIEKRPSIKQHDELLYALGIRYLRDFRWQDARKAFSSIHPAKQYIDWDYRGGYKSFSEYDKDPPKFRPFDTSIREIRPEWLEQDLRTVNDLERLEQNYNSAQGDEEKAEALYQFASYIYQGSLLFYNQLAWDYIRHYLISDLVVEAGFRQAGESQSIFEYMKKHDMASRSLELYLDVMKKYPNTKAAKDALYTSAVCHDRLRNYNGYWRTIYENGGYAGDKLITYKDVKRIYPDYRFPLGTNGWEPMTRTVNGGPGWAIPPKPKPKPPPPTFRQRTFSKLKGFAKSTIKTIKKTLRRSMKMMLRFTRHTMTFVLALVQCLWFGFSFSILCIVFGQARQARRRLREELARCVPENQNKSDAELCKEKQANASAPEQRGILGFAIKYGLLLPVEPKPVLPSLSLSGEPGLPKARFGNFLHEDLRDKWLAQVNEFLFKANQLRGDANGRSALILTLATHSMCLFLLVNLLLSW